MINFIKICNIKSTAKVLLFSVIWISNGYAENNLNRLIRGEYAFTIYRSCVIVPGDGGFDPETDILQTDAEHVTFVDSGVFHFDGNGNVETLETKVIQLNPNQLSPGQIPVLSGLSSSCVGNYNVNQDRRSYSSELTCSVQVGGGAILTITPFRAEGYFDRSRRTLTNNEVEGNIQKVVVSLGDFIIQTSERICTTSGTIIKVKSIR